jgi:integrase
MTFSGIRRVVYRRAEEAGLGKVYPHQLRHSWAHDQMASHQLSDGEIMQLAGWKSRVMLQIYAASVAQERALEAVKRNSLRDKL